MCVCVYVMVMSRCLCVISPCVRCMSYLILKVESEALDQLLCVKQSQVTVKGVEEASNSFMF